MSTRNALIESHSFGSEIKFRFKSSLLVTKRLLKNITTNIQRFSDKGQLQNMPVIAVSESDLWNVDDNEQNWILTAGKIQNLRIATKKLNGIEVAANQIFSFWKHIGNPNIGQGYVVGREIREGCIIPTIAGGLCQISNALYDAALKANFQIIERHKHTRVIKGSLAEKDRDATVKWNYVDLRFKSKHAFRIEIDITTEKLVIKFRSQEKNDTTIVDADVSLQASKINDCYSCGNFECFKHPDRKSLKQEKAITTFILDEKWPEYDQYIQSISTEKNFFIVPILKNRLIQSNRYHWTIKHKQQIKSTPFAALFRAFQLRFAAKINNNVFSKMLDVDKMVAKQMIKHIPIESTHLVISQNLLPFLWQSGVLGGRTFDVLMTRLPMEQLHERLDDAKKNFPHSKTLDDFRATQSLINAENTALNKARQIITPHHEIASIFLNKSILLDWAIPKTISGKNVTSGKILFPASALGRKGAYEMRRLAQELQLSIVIAGQAQEDEHFWKGIDVTYAYNNIFNEVSLVIYPTYIEHQPRLLLKALALGIPVITTTACGLPVSDNLTMVSIGDYDALKEVVTLYMLKQRA